MDEPHNPNEWKLCCSNSSKSFVKFLVQVLLGFTIILFSMVQIFRGVEGQSIYFSLISGTLGIFFPHPTLGEDNALTSALDSPSRPIPSHSRDPSAALEVPPPRL